MSSEYFVHCTSYIVPLPLLLGVSVSALFEEIDRIDGYVSIDGHIVHIHSKEEFLKEVDKSMSFSSILKIGG